MNSITTIIDGDTLVWNLAWNLQDKLIEEAEEQIDTYIHTILQNTNCTNYLGFLGDGKTFRHELYPAYKANRPDKPEWLTKWEPFIRWRLIRCWKFHKSGKLEAEDCCSICIEHYKKSTNIIYAHIDKDGNSKEGNHYNFNTHQFWYTDRLGSLELRQKTKSKKLYGTGLKWLYAQYLLGDKVDGIPNLKKGCGDVYVHKLLSLCNSEFSLLRTVYSEFLKHSTKEAFILNRQLIKMLDKEEYGFIIPELVPYNVNNYEIDFNI